MLWEWIPAGTIQTQHGGMREPMVNVDRVYLHPHYYFKPLAVEGCRSTSLYESVPSVGPREEADGAESQACTLWIREGSFWQGTGPGGTDAHLILAPQLTVYNLPPKLLSGVILFSWADKWQPVVWIRQNSFSLLLLTQHGEFKRGLVSHAWLMSAWKDIFTSFVMDVRNKSD